MGVLAIVVLLLLTLRPAPDRGAVATAPSSTETSAAEASPTTSATAPGTASATTEAATSPSSSSTSPSPSTTTRTLPDYRSTGRYSTVPGTKTVRGESGQLMTYRVEVEQGSGVVPKEFAAAVDRTLRHPRGWTAGGHWRFQRVSTDEADLVIRLATPESVDERCEAAGANTNGYTSCRAGKYILLNLDRWYIGVPHVKDLATYRNYLVNHEVGHGLGKGHEACTGKGDIAPVMLQQTLGLHGCVANAWPRDEDGELVTGPPAG